MNCSECDKWIDSFIDNELNVAEEKSFLEHLENCPECKQEYEIALSTVNLVKNYEELSMPVGLEIRMNNLIMAESEKVKQEQKAYEPKKVKGRFWQNLWVKAYVPSLLVAVLLFAFALNSYDLINTESLSEDDIMIASNDELEPQIPEANSMLMLEGAGERPVGDIPMAEGEDLPVANGDLVPNGEQVPRNEMYSQASRGGGVRPSEFYNATQNEIQSDDTIITTGAVEVEEIKEVSSQFILNIILGVALIMSVIYLILRKKAKIS